MTELNPVLASELRRRFRFWQAGLMLSLYLLAVGAFTLGFIYLRWRYGGMAFQPWTIMELFIFLSVTQLILLAFITPGLTAGTISGEREKQTLNVLLTTNLTPLSIITSKMAAACSFTVLMLLASLPIYSIVFMYGGIAPGQVLGVFVFYIVSMFLYAAIGMACSTWFRRTGTATVTAYGITFIHGAGTAILAAFIYEVTRATRGIQGDEPVGFIVQFLQNINPVLVLIRMMGEHAVIGTERLMVLPYWAVYGVFCLVVGTILVIWSGRVLNPLK